MSGFVTRDETLPPTYSQALESHSLPPLWTALHVLLPKERGTAAVPHRWSWREARPLPRGPDARRVARRPRHPARACVRRVVGVGAAPGAAAGAGRRRGAGGVPLAVAKHATRARAAGGEHAEGPPGHARVRDADGR